MSKLGLFSVGALLLALGITGCSGDEEENPGTGSSSSSSGEVTSSSSGGSSSSSGDLSSSSSGGSSSSSGGNPACAAPAEYPGADTFQQGAAVGLDLRGKLVALNAPMATMETNNAAGETDAAALKALYTATQAPFPSLSAVATQSRRDAVNGAIDAFVPALTHTFDPAAEEPEAGKFGKWIFDEHGVDLRQIVEKGSFGGELYRGFADPRPVAGRIDELVALFGASPAFNLTSAETDKPVHTAKYAADRDPNGLYASFKQQAILAKHAAGQGDTCSAELTAAVGEMKKIWEHALAATVVYYLDKASTELGNAGVDDQNVPFNALGLHKLGEVAGFLGGLRSLTAGERIITDAQLDEILGALLLGASPSPIDFATGAQNAATVFPAVIIKIQDAYGFTDAQIAEFKN